ncbi:MAG TPA: DSD1 family PLP-dependent enzyme [Quisquiliibacterium sp.]|nr:DSD1 family PLP-dependent enzyme [Quisquiliibacterium sp.]
MTAIPPPARVGDAVADVDTPALLLDLDVFDANVAGLHGEVARHGGRLRAHGKAHKCSEIGRRQVAAGAVGLCCQKVGEAEVFVAGGLRDVLVSNVVVGASKARRLAALAGRARVGVCVDSALQVAQLADATAEAGTRLDVLIEIDVGQRRCGVAEPQEAIALADAIAAAPGLALRGLQAYHGRAQHLRDPAERASAVAAAAARARVFRDALVAAGHRCDEICGAGTGSYRNELTSGLYTELQAGSYVLMDADYFANQPDPAAPPLGQALSVLCTVITVRPGHAVLDGGLKTFAVDSGKPQMMLPGWTVLGLSDEHTVIAPGEGAAPLAVGDKVRLAPGHCDPTVNLHDWFVAHRAGRVEGLWPIDARGALF